MAKKQNKTAYSIKELYADKDKNKFPLPLTCQNECVVVCDFEELKLYLQDMLDDRMEDGKMPFCFIVRELSATDDTSNYTREWLFSGGVQLSRNKDCSITHCDSSFSDNELVHIVYNDRLTVGFILRSDVNKYRMLTVGEDGCLKWADVPQSRVIKLRWEYHLPQELAEMLRYVMRNGSYK